MQGQERKELYTKKRKCEKNNFKKLAQVEPDPGTVPTCGVIEAIFSVLPQVKV
jgi:hypothetical protein